MNISSCNIAAIDRYLDDSLSPAEEALLESHLCECETCRTRMGESAGSGDDWASVAAALTLDELDRPTEAPTQPAWPLALLGPTDDPRMLGRIGPFEVTGCVGVGGMGIVFKARDPALDRFVAVKVLAPQLAASESARMRFAREAKAAAAVVHDHVIAIHQVSEYQNLPYLVMPYLPGPSLEQRLRSHGPLDVVEALRVAHQVAAGLAAAHAQGLVHRDIKPANILLSGDTERAVITDFGLARAADDATLTRAGMLTGTPQFMAPEQARGESVDARSDIFSLGAVLFTMLTGQPPVADGTGTETIRRVGYGIPPRLCQFDPSAPPWLDQLVARLLAFEPHDRMESARAVANLLEQTLAWLQDPQARAAPREVVAKPNYRMARFLILMALWVIGVFAFSWQQSQYWMDDDLSVPTTSESGTPHTTNGSDGNDGAVDRKIAKSTQPSPSTSNAQLPDEPTVNATTSESTGSLAVPASSDIQRSSGGTKKEIPMTETPAQDLDSFLQEIERDISNLEIQLDR